MAAQVSVIPARTVMEWMQQGTVVLVDVREPDERAQERIPGSVAMPLSQFDPASVPVDPAKHLVFHCKGGVRCGMAASRMIQAGFTGDMGRLEGGIMGWRAQGGAVER